MVAKAEQTFAKGNFFFHKMKTISKNNYFKIRNAPQFINAKKSGSIYLGD